MPPRRKVEEQDKSQRRPPAKTPEARENQMTALAHDLAEKQLREGTASSQIMTHYLKAGSVREKLEQERLANENLLLQAKIESLKSAKRMEELYEKAIDAMRSYSGNQTPEEESQDER